MSKMRPITNKHLLMLKDSHQRLINGAEPIGSYYTQTAKGLVERGLFEPREYSSQGKRLVGFYLTEKGMQYLQSKKVIDMTNEIVSLK